MGTRRFLLRRLAARCDFDLLLFVATGTLTYLLFAQRVLLDPDVAKVFRDSKSVNEALRALVEVANKAAAAG